MDCNEISLKHKYGRKEFMRLFNLWTKAEQVAFVKQLVGKMSLNQCNSVYTQRNAMKRVDIVSCLRDSGVLHAAENIFSYLDGNEISIVQQVCQKWSFIVEEGRIWKKLIKRNCHNNYVWRRVAIVRQWEELLYARQEESASDNCSVFYEDLYEKFLKELAEVEKKWRCGFQHMSSINCFDERRNGVCCLQYDDEKIVCGLRDKTIKIFDMSTYDCMGVLKGHSGSVLCLQYNEEVIISGSSDANIKVWDIKECKSMKTFIFHKDSVVGLKWNRNVMVTCSKDRSVAVWRIVSYRDIVVCRLLESHTLSVNAVDMDANKYVVSGSSDMTIRVWDIANDFECIKVLKGHRAPIMSLQYSDKLMVSGSVDKTVRLWEMESFLCLREFNSHASAVRCVRFNETRIVSAAYDGRIVVWDLLAALNPKATRRELFLTRLEDYEFNVVGSPVIGLQFDECKIIFGLKNGRICIADFLDSRRYYNENNLIDFAH